jgi:putative DNA primase/helicase
MMAREVAAVFGGGRCEGRNWRVPCPIHGGRFLALADGRNGALLIYCFGGCDSRHIWAYLRGRGLVAGSSYRRSPEQIEELRRRDEAAVKAAGEKIRHRISRARALYVSALPAAGTPVEAYLRSRGITIPVPPVLRWLRLCPHRNGHYYPAMVAPIVDVSGEQIGVHKTFLRPDGSGKADLPKEEQRETCGVLRGGAVRLVPHRPGLELLVGEGIETTLAAMQMFGLPGMATVCAPGIKALDLPQDIARIAIAADHDENMVGQCAALRARERLAGEGRSVRILLPPKVGEDFNDVLLEAEQNGQ